MAKKKKGGGPQRKRIKFEVNADIDQTRFLKVYDVQCNNDKSAQCTWLVKAMKKGIEDRRYTREFIIEDQAAPLVRLDPIISSIRKSHYQFITDLRIWDLSLVHSSVANIALLIEKGVYPIVKLELMDCDLLSYSVERLVRSFRISNLVEVNLDYNEFGDEGCQALCRGCSNNKTIISLSLCYCALTSKSGAELGEVAYHSTIREFYLDGNRLEARGLESMLKSVAVAAEDDHTKRVEEERAAALRAAELASIVDPPTQMEEGATSGGGTDAEKKVSSGKKEKKKKKKKGKKKEPPPPPIPGPQVFKLHVADNGIDSYGEGRREQLLSCAAVVARLLMYSHCLAELDLEDNPIGDLAAGEILEALKSRQLGGLPNVKLRVSCEIAKDTFSQITKLASGVSKKKKKGKKKKKVANPCSTRMLALLFSSTHNKLTLIGTSMFYPKIIARKLCLNWF